MSWVIVAALAGGVAALSGAFYLGYRLAHVQAEADQGETFMKAKREADEREHELTTSTDAELDARLDEWMRPDQ